MTIFLVILAVRFWVFVFWVVVYWRLSELCVFLAFWVVFIFWYSASKLVLRNSEQMENTQDSRDEAVEKFEPSATVMTVKKSPVGVYSVLALVTWLSLMHISFGLLVLALFLLPGIWGYTLLGLLLVLAVSPIDDEGELGNRVATFICQNVRSYFPVTLVVEDMKAFDPKRSYVLAFEPHSVLPIGIVALPKQMGLMPLPKVKALASSAIFFTPILRQVWTWLGMVSATRKNFVNYLKSGYSVIVIPGGMQEVLYMEHGKEVAYLKKRHGFIRVAIETGSPVVPIFCFGQTNVFNWWRPKGGSLYGHLCRILKFSPLLFWGHYGTPVPYAQPMDVVVGKPIEVRQNPQPSTEEILEVQAQFISAMQELYEKHKVAVGYKDIPLQIV